MSRNINDLHPYVKELALKLIQECRKQKIEIRLVQTLRTKQEQDEIYAQGRTKPGKIVTNAKGGYSFHNYGLAFDVCIFENNKPNWNTNLYDKVGSIGVKLGLEWGGNFKSIKDKPHFQYTQGLKISDLIKGRKIFTNPISSENYIFIDAVKKLTSKGVISSPTYWILNTTYELEYFYKLINNFTKQSATFEQDIKYLSKTGVIDSPEYWINNKTYSVENIKKMIIKLAEHI